MPTYKNETDKRITFAYKGLLEWFPGQEHRLEYFIPHEILGLAMIDPEPFVLRGKNLMLDYTELLIAPWMALEHRIVKIPYSETVLVSVEVRAGWLRMYVGDSEVPIVVDRDNNHVSVYPWDMSSYLVFEADEPTAVYMKFEPYTFRGRERRPA